MYFCVSGARAFFVRLLHERTNKSRMFGPKQLVWVSKKPESKEEKSKDRGDRERENEIAKHKLLFHCLLLLVAAPDCTRRDSEEQTR